MSVKLVDELGTRVELRDDGTWKTRDKAMLEVLEVVFPYRGGPGPSHPDPIFAHAELVAERLGFRITHRSPPEFVPGRRY